MKGKLLNRFVANVEIGLQLIQSIWRLDVGKGKTKGDTILTKIGNISINESI